MYSKHTYQLIAKEMEREGKGRTEICPIWIGLGFSWTGKLRERIFRDTPGDGIASADGSIRVIQRNRQCFHTEEPVDGKDGKDDEGVDGD
jgi:hypothetical protein